MESPASSTSQEGEKEELPVKQTEESQASEVEESGGAVQTRGRQLWLRLKKGFRRAVEKIKNEEMKVAYLSHGLQHLCRISFLSPVRHVTHHSLQKVLVVLDADNGLHSYTEDGFYLSSRRAPVPMAGLLYASQVDRFVAWDRGALRVLGSSFEVLSEVLSALPICCGLYSELLNRIVTAGDGNLTIWGFRYGSRSLQCRALVSGGLGPSVVFSHLALDTSGTEPQRCFASCDTGAAAFEISEGSLISFKTNLHSRRITDIVYCEAAGSPVTASRDATIKVWDETWHIRTVFVGHTAPVIALATYPQRPLIFSASQDGTIRTWNLDTVDQVDQVHVSEPVEALETQAASRVLSVSGLSLTLWKINKLYSLFAPLGSPAKRLSCIDLKAVADFPTRILCVCQDSTVRVLDAPTGAVQAVLSLEPPFEVLDVAYCLPRETLFVLTQSGSLLRVNAATDPMVRKKSTASPCRESWPSCLLLYSHIVDPQKAYAGWLEVVANKSDRKAWQAPPLRMQDKNRYVLIMGQDDGLLSVVEWFSGRIQCQVAAHSSQRVTALAEYPSQTCVISAGADRTVKMWRVFPYAVESLVLLLCFSCAVPAWHLCSLHETLAAAFQDPETATYSIVHYNLMQQTRCNHRPEDDPQDDITGLCCCPDLNLFASASRDGSVKVWNSENKLLRHLKLDTIPESLAFANPQGDLLVGIERHLYLIHHKKYLPSYYNMTLLCARFLEPIQHSSLPISRASFEALVQDNVRRLKEEPSLEEEAGSPLLGARQMSVQESKVLQQSQVQAQVLTAVDARDEDLRQLQMGTAQAAKKVRLSRDLRAEAFERYLRIFYKQQPKVEIPEEDVFNADDVLEALSRCRSVSELYGPNLSNMFLGAFPQLASLKAAQELLKDADFPPVGKVSVASAPPSSVTPLPGGQEASAPQQQVRKETGEQLSQATAEGTRPATPSPQEKRKPLQPRRSPSPLALPEASAALAVGARKPAESLRAPSLEGRFLETVFGKIRLRRGKPEKGLSPIIEVELRSLKSPSWPISLASSSIVGAARSGKSLSSEEAWRAAGSHEMHKPSRSSSSSETIKGFFPEAVASRDRIQTRREPGGLLLPKISSGFIPNSVVAHQLHAQDLLPSVEQLVKEAGALEEPQSPSRVSSVQTDVQDQPLETEPLRDRSASLSWTSTQEPSLPSQASSRVFLTQLDESHYPESETTSEEDISAFHLRFKDANWFKQLFPKGLPPEMDKTELLARLLAAMPSGDFGTKAQLLDAILSLREAWGPGMSDMVHNALVHLLNMKRGAPSMQEETQQRFILAVLRALLTLNKESRDLMVELMTYYLLAPPQPRLIIEGLLEEVGVRDPHRHFYKELDSWPAVESGTKEELRKVCSLWLDRAMRDCQEHRVLLALKQKSRGKHSCKFSPKPKLPHPQRRDTCVVHPVDAVNHFIEKHLVDELRQLVAQAEERPRDTVMALPPLQKRQAILRLGETNAMLRNRIPEHFYFPYIFPRYLMKGFAPFVKLPLPKINLSPFPLDPEKLVPPKAFTAKQQLVQKYFIPKFSYADSYP
ncbi:WD repeat-containing protein 97 [Paroedura picta]|uniref:WD repeat-containing protein 97 n=1 Tax=Paroedura picta TaxID=143630 RepID=UPI00405712BE